MNYLATHQTAWAFMALALTASPNIEAQVHAAGVEPPRSIPTFSTENIARKGFFFVGGQYVGEPGQRLMAGHMYVEVWVPREVRQPYSVVLLHGGGQSSMYWQQTPDGRRGWAYHLIDEGYVVYMVEDPGRGRSAYVPSVYGEITFRTAELLERTLTNVKEAGNFPQKDNHSQWVGAGKPGDPIFDNLIRMQSSYVSGQEALAVEAAVALLDRVGTPVVLVAHSQGGSNALAIADRRPNAVKGIVAIEPAGPPMASMGARTVIGERTPGSWGPTNLPLTYHPPVSDPDEDLKVYLEPLPAEAGQTRCYLQQEPAHTLINLQSIPAVVISGSGSYHRIYDHCTAKWLEQAGMSAEFLRLEDVGIDGNGHLMMMENNSDRIIQYIHRWISERVE